MTTPSAPGPSTRERPPRWAGPAGTPPPAPRYPVDFDDRLAEEAVLLALDRASAALRSRFHEDRDHLYELADEETREERFRDHHAAWFVRLGLDEALGRALGAEPAVAAGTRRCRVLRAAHPGEEYADLVDLQSADGGPEAPLRPILLLRLVPRTLVDADRLRSWLRRELIHIADLLDPAFGFDRVARLSPGAPGLENLVRRRYRLLWEVTVDGRLGRAGELPPRAEERLRRDFLAAFPTLGDSAASVFERLYRGPRPSHAALAALARDPRRGDRAGSAAAGRCPVCRMPSHELVRGPHLAGDAVVASIRRSAPGWGPQQGLCRQCLDLLRGPAQPF